MNPPISAGCTGSGVHVTLVDRWDGGRPVMRAFLLSAEQAWELGWQMIDGAECARADSDALADFLGVARIPRKAPPPKIRLTKGGL